MTQSVLGLILLLYVRLLYAGCFKFLNDYLI